MAANYALGLTGVYGFNKDVAGGVLNLSNGERNAIFYVSAHTAIIHDLDSGEQKVLQGHSNKITSVTSSIDRRWVATADTGSEECMVVVWDTTTGTPVKTLFKPHAEGATAMHMCEDASILATVGMDEGGAQVLSLWAWTEDTSAPIASVEIPSEDPQTCVRFHRQDASQLLTNGKSSVFFCTMLEDGEFDVYSPQIDPADFRQGIGEYTQSLFIPDSSEVISATVDGDVVVWDESMLLAPPDETGEMRKQAVKIIKLHTNGGINFLDMHENSIVTGGSDGFVRFYDFKLRMVAWFDYFNNGPVTSIDFARTGKEVPAMLTAENFDCEDFVFGTSSAQIVMAGTELLQQLEMEDRRGTVVVQGFEGKIESVATHPAIPVALASTSSMVGKAVAGRLHVADLAGGVTGSRELEPLSAMEYTPDGSLVMCGSAGAGSVHILDASTLEDVQTLSPLDGPVERIAVAPDGQSFATVDSTRATTIFKYMVDPEALVGVALDEVQNEPEKKCWVFVGSYRAHYKAVSALVWGPPAIAGDTPRLWTVGQDGFLVEYDVDGSSVEGGVQLKKRERVLRSPIPSAAGLLPGYGGSYLKEDVLVMCDDQYKLKVQRVPDGSTDPSSCRKTVLGPTYGDPVSSLCAFPGSDYMLYSTPSKVMGLIKTPLDGNPSRCIGMVAHPGEISGCTPAVQPNGDACVVTAGGEDGTLMVWTVDLANADSRTALGGEGMEPFCEMLAGGKGGTLHEEMVDYFYLAQLKAQGVGSVAEREISGKVPFDHTASLLRAAGYYPSEGEVADILEELKHETYNETGELTTELTFDSLLKVFVNHRPVVGVGPDDIEEAFLGLGAPGGSKLLSHEQLLKLMAERGEPLVGGELTACFEELLGPGMDLAGLGSTDITPQEMAEGVLGFGAGEGGEEEEGDEGVEP
jgi:WD40 repeat protein